MEPKTIKKDGHEKQVSRKLTFCVANEDIERAEKECRRLIKLGLAKNYTAVLRLAIHFGLDMVAKIEAPE